MYLNVPIVYRCHEARPEKRTGEQIPEDQVQQMQERADNIRQGCRNREMPGLRLYIGRAYRRGCRHQGQRRTGSGQVSPFFFKKKAFKGKEK